MNAEHIIKQCSSLGLRLSTDGQNLNVTGDKSNLVSELMVTLKENKASLIAYIKQFSALENERQRYNINLVDRNGPLPVSSAQNRIWLSQQIPGSASIYNMPNGMHVLGNFDEHLARQATRLIIARHEILRTVLHYEDNQLVQIVKDAGDVNFIIEDFSHLNLAQSKALALELLRQDADKPFDLENDLMLRGGFLRHSEDNGTLFFNVHHIAADGWSMALLFEEFKYFYSALFNGTSPTLPAVPLQYADYANWQSQLLDSEQVKHSKSYWLQQLQDLPAVNSIPLDYVRPASTGGRSDFRVAELSPSLTRRLKALAITHKTSLFVLFHALVSILVGRYAHSNDVVIGTPVAGRRQKELEKTFGCFINTLVLRLRTPEGINFAELLAAAKQTNESALEHQDIPFEYLVEALQPERSNSYHPLFQIALVQNNLDVSNAKVTPFAGDVTFESFDTAELSAKYDIQINLVEHANNIQVSFAFDTNLFKGETIARMAQQLENLCEQVADDTEITLLRLQLSDASEREEITAMEQVPAYQANNLPIQRYIESWAASSPEKKAVSVAGSILSYGELNTQANQLARYMLNLGITKGTYVGVAFERSPELIIAMLATVKVGAVYVPLDPNYPSARLDYMIEDTALKYVLTVDKLAHLFHEYKINVLPIDARDVGLIIQSLAAQNLDLDIKSGDLAYIIYTSGSTGQPKGVMIEHAGIERLVCKPNYVSLSPSDNMLFISNTAFDAATFEIWGALANGATLHGLDNSYLLDANKFIEEVTRLNITTTFITAALFNQIVAIRPDAFAMFNYVLVGGDKLDKSSVDRVMSIGKPKHLINVYGPTENTTFSTFFDIEEVGDVQYPIGRPISGTGCYILDENQQKCAVGVIGELYLSGLGLARGYLNKVDTTAERFVAVPSANHDRLYRTGDMVKWDEQGNICFIGRTDNQVKIRGFRIEVGEIEHALLRLSDIKEVAVQVESEATQKILVAYVTCQQVSSSEELKSALKSYLPIHMLPAHIVVLADMPLNANGKIDRNRLVRKTQNQVEKLTPPTSPLAHSIAQIWQESMQLSPDCIGMQSNFFELGGHSLLVMNVVHTIHRTLKSQVPVQCLFENPVLAQFVALVEQYQHTDSSLTVPKASSCEDGYPLSAAQRRMWFIDQLDNESTHYNLNYQFEVRGEFDVALAERAFSLLLSRHEILRTSYHETDTDEIQLVQPVSAFVLEHSCVTRDDYSDELDKVQARLGRRFDLTKAPLLRVAYIDVAAESTGTLLLCLHHIATDGWSMNVLFNEFVSLYRSELAGENNPLVANSLSYIDYAVWQTQYQKSEACRASLSYWKEQLSKAPAQHDIQLDFPRPKMKRHAGAVLTRTLPKAQAEKLKHFIGAHNLTSFMLAHAALSLVVAQHGRDSQCVIGTPVAGRHEQQLANLVGLFVNTVALTAKTDFDTLGDYLSHIRDVNIAAQAHNLVPFDSVVDALNVTRTAAISPIFQIMLTTDSEESFRIGAAQPVDDSTNVEFISKTSSSISTKFDLDIHFDLSHQQLTIHWVYDTSLFNVSSIERLAEQMEQVLGELAERSTQSHVMTTALSDLVICSVAQTEALASSLNNSTVLTGVREESLLDTWSKTVARQPDDIALFWQGNTWTWQELAHQVTRCAQVLHSEHGVGRGRTVAVQMEKSADMVVALLAILASGAAYLPIDPKAPRQRVEYVLVDAKACLLISQPLYLCEHTDDICPSTTMAALAATRIAEETILHMPSADDLAYVMYTSGTTGQPKGVMVSHRNAVALMTEMQAWPICQGKQNWGWNANYVFDASVQGLLQLIAGTALTPVPEGLKVEPHLIGEYLCANQVTVLDCTPSLVDMWLDEGLDEQLPNLIIGGEAISESLWHRLVDWQRRNDRIALNVYGPTECTVNATMTLISGTRPNIGKPLSYNNLYVLDVHQRPVAQGMSGELYISGDGVAQGYVGKPELSAQSFIENGFKHGQRSHPLLYKTGDIVRFSDGVLEYLGRADSQVKLNGYRIELAEIEQQLMALPEVTRAHVVISQQAGGTQVLVAYLQPTGVISLDYSEIGVALSLKLPSYMVPQQFVTISHWPMTRNGKLDIQALPQREVEMSGEELSTTTEHTLADIWRTVLKLPSNTVLFRDSRFFDLGGNSLQAVALARVIRKTFETTVSTLDVFQQQTLSALAAKVTLSKINENEDPQLVCLREGDSQQVPIIFIHPVGGQLTCYTEIAAGIKSDASIYGFQSINQQFESITTLAEHYLALLDVKVGAAAYRLIGWSMGGVIGHSMQGLAPNKIQKLIMIDSYVPEIQNIVDDELTRMEAFVAELGISTDGISLEDIRHLQSEQLLTLVHSLCLSQGRVSEDYTLADLQAQWQILTQNQSLFVAHTCTPSQSIAHLIYAKDFTALNGWSALLSQCDAHGIANTDHHSILRSNKLKLLINKKLN